jgi:acyl-CoA dehydrogenase
VFTCKAVRDGDEWVINGWKFFSSHARWAAFLIVMVVTDPDVPIHSGASMFIVPADTPGVEIVRNVGHLGDKINDGSHALVHYDDVRVPADHLLGEEGKAFAVAQVRLGGGRVHHAMRAVGHVQKCLDMMCERALSRYTQGTILADKYSVQSYIADTYAELMSFRLMVLYTAWRIDKIQDYSAVRHDIAAIKAMTPQVMGNAVQRAIQVHGALGITNELPLAHLLQASVTMGIVDGPTEVHKVSVARQLLKRYTPADGMWPSEWLPGRMDRAKAKFEAQLGREVVSSR